VPFCPLIAGIIEGAKVRGRMGSAVMHRSCRAAGTDHPPSVPRDLYRMERVEDVKLSLVCLAFALENVTAKPS
jgi:hypothetical protein